MAVSGGIVSILLSGPAGTELRTSQQSLLALGLWLLAWSLCLLQFTGMERIDHRNLRSQRSPITRKSRDSSQKLKAKSQKRSLLHKLRRPSGQALDSLRDGRVGGEQAAEIYPEQRRNDEQMRC